ncbi:MAG: M28 family peptidase [Candidatus Coatesbacteria bacterium]|nr:M28 family peptidase [Candidatus Coatesbacteria bacterium]
MVLLTRSEKNHRSRYRGDVLAARRLAAAAAMLLLAMVLACNNSDVDFTPPPTPAPVPFDADRAFSHLIAQVGFGPRVPGSRGHTECQDYIMRHLSATARSIQTQRFEIECYGDGIFGTNILASFGRGDLSPMLFACHWDTRPVADKDPFMENRHKPIPGANDGASGVAVLLELATQFHANPPKREVVLAFLDAEDSGDYESCKYCIGSYQLGQELDTYFPNRPVFGVLIDMIGDKDLSIPKEAYSSALAPDVVSRVWGIARRLGYSQFKDELGNPVFDDHVWLNRAGIPTIDIIDFDYPVWHTLGDTPDNCSKTSLKAVGDVLYVLANED